MRIAFAPMGSEGDLRPVAALGRALREAGHEVVVAGSPDFEPLFARHGIPFRPCGSAFRPVAEALAGRINGRPFSGMRAMIGWCRQAVAEQFGALSPHLERCDRILGCGVQFAASSLAERRGVPYRHVAHFAGILPSSHHPPVTVPVFGLPSWGNRALWAASGAAMNLLLRSRIDHQRAILGLPSIGDFGSHFTRAALIAVDPELAPLPSDAGAGVRQTGYWRIDDEGALPREVEAFLEAGPKPVFVGFGSMGDPDPGATAREVVAGIRRGGWRGIVASGWAGLDPADRGDDLLVVGHLPHGLLFPRVAAVVHHGGAGTTWVASRSGVPQVVVPHLLDQHWWARRLESLGVAGGSLSRRRLDAGRLHASLRQALDPRRSAAIARLAASLANRDGIRQAVALLEGDPA